MRAAINRLIAANKKRMSDIRKSGELITSYESGAVSEISYQNMMLQAILNTRE